MDDNQITHVLNIFCQYPRCFALEELADFADSDSDNEALSHALLVDSRFLQLREEDSAEGYFVPKKNLFLWFCQLSLKLAQAKQARLNKYQVATLMSSLRIDGRWNTPPMEAIQFGSHFGFIGPAWTADEYVFPIAHILSFTKFQTLAIRPIIENFPAGESPQLPFDQLGRNLIEEGLSRFSKRVRYVVQEREGLLTGRKMTLQQIGDRLGFSREYIRQVEERFWKKLHQGSIGLYSLFSTALTCNLITRHGSLIVSQNSSETPLLSFLAKCVGVPQTVFPNTHLLILGTSPKEAILPRSTGSVHEGIHIDFIATQLDSKGHLCLTCSDLSIVAEAIAQFRRKHFTKGQKAYLALRAIGKPAHCAAITQMYNSLFPEQSSTERNLHAVLSREEYGVVWIGIRSTFALKEWGYEHPSTGLFDIAVEIVKKRYEETGQPVPYAVVVAEIGKHRQLVNPASLTIAAHCNPNLQRIGKDSFIPKEPTEDIQEEISAEELDRILKEFEKENNKTPVEQEPPPISGEESHSSRFRHVLLNFKQKLTSLHS